MKELMEKKNYGNEGYAIICCIYSHHIPLKICITTKNEEKNDGEME